MCDSSDSSDRSDSSDGKSYDRKTKLYRQFFLWQEDLSNNSKTENVERKKFNLTKLKKIIFFTQKLKCDRTQKLLLWQYWKTQVGTKLKTFQIFRKKKKKNQIVS